MLAPPNPEMRRAPLAGPEIAKSEHQEQRYRVAADSQAALFLLAPMIFLIAILAFAGGLR